MGLFMASSFGCSWVLAQSDLQQPTAPKSVDGDATIRAPHGNSEIVITTTNRLAGAIHSVTWDGMEFIDSADHGRQLQSAASFDCAKPGPFWAEAFNPTEAGSRLDGAGNRSTSQLLSIEAHGNALKTRTQLAFWLAPHENSFGRPALNATKLSNHLLEKHVCIGFQNLPNVIQYDVQFSVPENETHHFAQFEALTGYMPYHFNQFWILKPDAISLERLSDGPGEQAFPVVFSNETKTHAMGVFSPDQPSTGFESAGYGRFRFLQEQVVKWNCTFRVRKSENIKTGDYRFAVFVAIGSLQQVQDALLQLRAATR
jgi:hypothetical protein